MRPRGFLIIGGSIGELDVDERVDRIVDERLDRVVADLNPGVLKLGGGVELLDRGVKELSSVVSAEVKLNFFSRSEVLGVCFASSRAAAMELAQVPCLVEEKEMFLKS